MAKIKKNVAEGTDAQTANEEQTGKIGLVGALAGVTAGLDQGLDAEGGADGFDSADSLDQSWGESTDHTAVQKRSGVYAQDRLGPRQSAHGKRI